MKKIKFAVFFIFAVCLLPIWAGAQFSDTRELVKRFAVSPETQIEIANKYGKIEVNTWDKDSAVFEISIRVEEKKLSKLEEAIRNIEFDITDSQNYLIVRTEVEKNLSGLAKEIKRFKETLLSSDGNMQVDYTVWIPDSNRLKIENKYGDVYIGDYKGEVSIDLSNGNLKANNFEKDFELVLNFGDATINAINNGRLDCNFSELYLKKAASLRINSRSTEFDIQEINDLNADSRRDQYKIQQIDLLDVKSSFSTFRVNELSDRVNIRAEYGDLEVDHISDDFSNIFVQTKSTDISLYFPPEINFDFEISHSKAELSLSDKVTTKSEEVSEDEKTTTIKGSYGKETKGAEKLNITAESGSIDIRSR